MQLTEGVTITGAVVDEFGHPIAASVLTYGPYVHPVVTDQVTGGFSLSNVHVDPTLQLLVVRKTGCASKIIYLDIQNINDNIHDLGNIVVPCPVADSSISISIPPTIFLVYDLPSPLVLNGSVTVVSESGALAYMFRIDSDTHLSAQMAAPILPGGAVPVPAGRYDIVPGPAVSSAVQTVVEALRAGDKAGLDAAGIPSIEAQAGGPVANIEVDLLDAIDAIKAYSKR
jgi:hypothetical protein